MPEVYAIDHIVLNVKDAELSARWYEQVLGIQRHETTSSSGGMSRIRTRFGFRKINLRPITATQKEWFTAHHPAAVNADLCFPVSVDPLTVAKHLQCG